jgi:hypothetical protein
MNAPDAPGMELPAVQLFGSWFAVSSMIWVPGVRYMRLMDPDDGNQSCSAPELTGLPQFVPCLRWQSPVGEASGAGACVPRASCAPLVPRPASDTICDVTNYCDWHAISDELRARLTWPVVPPAALERSAENLARMLTRACILAGWRAVPSGPAADLAVQLGYELLFELVSLAHHGRMLKRARPAYPPAQPGYRGGGGGGLRLDLRLGGRAMVMCAGAAASWPPRTPRRGASLRCRTGFDGQHTAGDTRL